MVRRLLPAPTPDPCFLACFASIFLAEMAAILTDLSADPPPPRLDDEWLDSGPHVGARVRLMFEGVGESEGTVVRYLPPDGDDCALWHIEHDDGDEEDLEEHELADGLARLSSRAPDGLQDHAGPFLLYANGTLPPKQRVAKRLLAGSDAARDGMVTLLDDAAKGMVSAGSAWAKEGGGKEGGGKEGGGKEGGRAATPPASAGAAGGGAPSASATQWRALVESASDAPACAALLLELESRVREAQTAADLVRTPGGEMEEEEEEGEAEAEEAEGEEKAAAEEEEVSKPAKLPKSASAASLKKAAAAQAAAEARAAAAVEAAEAAAAASGGERRLWPDVEARQHWQQYVRSAATFSQLAVGCLTLRDRAMAFGLVGKKAEHAVARRRCEHVWDVPV